MKRRNFLIGTAGTALGGSALLGSGTITCGESQRQVSIQVTNDADAYLRIELLDTPNSNNFVDYDENGDLYIDVVAHDGFEQPGIAALGEGVNSDSFIYFDGLFEFCNQGKADATVGYEYPSPEDRNVGDNGVSPTEDYDEQMVAFYYIADEEDENPAGERVIIEEGNEIPLPLDGCEEIGLRTVAKGMDGTTNAALVDGEVLITANAPEAEEPGEDEDGHGKDDASA